jgi:hypothetical protein
MNNQNRDVSPEDWHIMNNQNHDISAKTMLEVYTTMGRLIGTHTAILAGETEDPSYFTDEQINAGKDACSGLCRAVVCGRPDGSLKDITEFAYCVLKFCMQTGDYIDKNPDRFGSPREFLLHVTGYAVLTNQDWDKAMADVMSE